MCSAALNWRIWCLVAAVGVLVGAFPVSAEPVVTQLRFGNHPDATRLVLEMSERVPSRVFTLANPYRVVIDLPEVSWRLSEGAAAKGAGLVKAYRFGVFEPGTSRVVLDLKAPARVKSTFFLPPAGSHRHRLVLDLEKTNRDVFEKELRSRPARRAATKPPPSRPRARPRDGKRVVVIDPGHGGVDPGTIGRSGTQEKSITLTFARELRKRLEATGRYRVVLTRDGDVFVRLRDRIAKARQAGAELFISLHADSLKNRRVRGASVYTLSETASDKEAAALAAKENKADLIAGMDLSEESPEVTSILIDLAQRETKNRSAILANILIKELGRSTKLLRKSHRFAGFAVLKAPDVASVLLEMGYLSNRQDEKLLRSRSHRAKLGAAILKAVDKYFAHTDRLARS